MAVEKNMFLLNPKHLNLRVSTVKLCLSWQGQGWVGLMMLCLNFGVNCIFPVV